MWMADDATKLHAMAPVDEHEQVHLAHGSSRGRCAGHVWITVVLSVALWIASGPSPGLAEPKPASSGDRSDRAALQSDYDQVIDRAVAAFQAEDYAAAHELFEQAYALQPNARVLRGLGIAALRLGHYTEAKRQLTAALADKRQALTATHRSEVSKLLGWIHGNLGVLELQWKPREPADTRVFCDDELVRDRTLVLLPGPHRLSVSAAGFKPQIHAQEVHAQETQTLELTLEPEHPEAVSPAPVAAASLAPKHVAATVSDVAPTSAIAVKPEPAPKSSPREAPASSSVLTRWWFWTGVAVLAVGGGVATAFALKGASSTPAYEQGGVGSRIMVLERGR